MKEEIRVGVEFFRQFLTKYGIQLAASQIDMFAEKLTSILHERYVNHWYADMPMKGQAFRCLRLKRSENYIDPVLEKTLSDLKLNLNQLGLPNDFTLWIDPGEVSVRFGDQVGYTYTIARLDPTVCESSVVEAVSTCSKQANSCLIVQNAEKILFDEKLTAFIRQNSSNTTEGFSSLTADEDMTVVTSQDVQHSNDLNINELIKLSAERRTISPPSADNSLRRKNSANIAIVNGQQSEAAAKPGRSKSKSIKSTNRFSFNDSCYYSSSSSSCASSFGSNNEESNLVSNLGNFFKSFYKKITF